MRSNVRWMLFLVVAVFLWLMAGQTFAQQAAPSYEVWAADQNGNIVYVLDPDGKVLRMIDGATLGDAKRPHMLWGVPKDEFVYSTNTVSNSVTVLSNKDGAVKAVIPGVGKAPHAAQPNPQHPEQLYISNIAPQAAGADGKADRGETIAEVVRSNGKWELTRYLDLKTAAPLADSNRFPSRRPVCVGFSKDGRYLLATLFSGGLAVVDLQGWNVVKAWGKDEMAENGCGFATSPSGDDLYITAGNLQSSWLYVFDVTAEPKLVATHNLTRYGQDSHGLAVDPSGQTLWVLHRVSSNVTIHPLADLRKPDHAISVIDFVGKTPDLLVMSPDHRRAYASLRGPTPAPTIPHATVGETPGVAIIDVASRKLLKVVHLGDKAADFHGIFIPASQR